jgi:hypothetical protein
MKAGNRKLPVRKSIHSAQESSHIVHAIPVLFEMLSSGDPEGRQLAAATLDHMERCCPECRSLLVRSRVR